MPDTPDQKVQRRAVRVAAGRCMNHPERPVAPGSRSRCQECLDYIRVANYGITPLDFECLMERQNWLCAIPGCGKDLRALPRRQLTLDHDHAFDARDPVGHRGVVCSECNLMLGKAYDKPERLRGAAEYLERHRAEIGTYRAWLGFLDRSAA